jgi:hypothetical protein
MTRLRRPAHFALIFAFLAFIGMLTSQAEAQSRAMNSETDICAAYVGQVVGHHQGQPVQLTCEMVRAGSSNVHNRPPFRELYVLLQEIGHRGYEAALGADASRCRRDRLSSQRSLSCEFPSGTMRLYLGPSDQIDTIILSVPGERATEGVLSSFAARYGWQPNVKFREMAIHIVTLAARRGSLPGELYSTDGRTLRVELRRN